MVALIVTVCALLDGADCHDETFYFESHGSLNVCMYEAPLYLAQWGSAHAEMADPPLDLRLAGAQSSEDLSFPDQVFAPHPRDHDRGRGHDRGLIVIVVMVMVVVVVMIVIVIMQPILEILVVLDQLGELFAAGRYIGDLGESGDVVDDLLLEQRTADLQDRRRIFLVELVDLALLARELTGTDDQRPLDLLVADGDPRPLADRPENQSEADTPLGNFRYSSRASSSVVPSAAKVWLLRFISRSSAGRSG